MNKKLKKTIITAALVIYLIILLLGAFVINPVGESSPKGSDKLLHFFGFLVLEVLLLLTFINYKLNHKYLATFLIALGIGLIIEVVQLSIPSRQFSLLDLAADAGGIALAMVLTWSFSKL
jgi:VanZ family protein